MTIATVEFEPNIVEIVVCMLEPALKNDTGMFKELVGRLAIKDGSPSFTDGNQIGYLWAFSRCVLGVQTCRTLLAATRDGTRIADVYREASALWKHTSRMYDRNRWRDLGDYVGELTDMIEDVHKERQKVACQTFSVTELTSYGSLPSSCIKLLVKSGTPALLCILQVLPPDEKEAAAAALTVMINECIWIADKADQHLQFSGPERARWRAAHVGVLDLLLFTFALFAELLFHYAEKIVAGSKVTNDALRREAERWAPILKRAQAHSEGARLGEMMAEGLLGTRRAASEVYRMGMRMGGMTAKCAAPFFTKDSGVMV